jgi:hypothetical protein
VRWIPFFLGIPVGWTFGGLIPMLIALGTIFYALLHPEKFAEKIEEIGKTYSNAVSSLVNTATTTSTSMEHSTPESGGVSHGTESSSVDVEARDWSG